jgi:N-acyl-D-amino-acid deacylase
MERACVVLAFLIAAEPARGDAPKPAEVKAAVEKGLNRIRQGADSYPKHRNCFSCHHQATALFSLDSAARHGFTIDQARREELVRFTLKSFAKKDTIARGQGIGGANTTAAYALAALAAGGHPADDTTDALVQFLLVRQRADGAWPGVTNRPPTEGSPFTATAMALFGLKHYVADRGWRASADMQKRTAAAAEKGRAWLLQNRGDATEDRVFRLRGLVHAGAAPADVEAARDELLGAQRDDGSWAQLPKMDGDAYATGTALMALRLAGLGTDHAAYRRGARWLLKEQKDDGSWIVETRSRPIQIFFDNGDPGGKSQFISFAATGWATLALLELSPAAGAPPGRAGP